MGNHGLFINLQVFGYVPTVSDSIADLLALGLFQFKLSIWILQSFDSFSHSLRSWMPGLEWALGIAHKDHLLCCLFKYSGCIRHAARTRSQQPTIWVVCHKERLLSEIETKPGPNNDTVIVRNSWSSLETANLTLYEETHMKVFCVSLSVLLFLVSSTDSLKLNRWITGIPFIHSLGIRAVYQQPSNSSSVVQGATSSVVILIDLQTAWTAKHGFAV